MIQRGFTSQERAARLHEVVERLLTVKEGDALRLEAKGLKTKAGAADLGLKIAGPFKMSGNLAGSMALARLNLAGMLNDKRIVRSTVEALFKYLREEEGGYFTTDGLGYETSPHYTHTAVGNLIAPFDALVGWKEGFGPGDPFWDNGAQALNPYLEPTLGKIAYSTLLSVLPDGRCAPWSDSWVTERPQLGMAEKVANATGRVPERFLPWLDVERGRDGRISLRLKEAMTLPSYVIPANGVAVMRLGEGLDQTFASVDWSRATGHSHDGPFNLLLYGARHEALCDQGYLNKATPTQDWMNSAEAHNTALVRTARGHSRPCVTWRGALRFFADAPSAKAVEVAEENQKKLSDGMPAGQQILFQRTVTLLATAGTPAGAYVVDIFRLQGGTTHDYYIHALGDRTDFDGVAPQPVADAALSLHEVSKFSYRASSGAKVITNLSTGRTDGAFTATWHTITDWRSMPPTLDTQAVTRVRLLAEPGTEVFLGQATGQRYMDGRDIAQKVNVLCARRNAEAYRDAPDAFVAVIDIRPDRNDAIAGVERLAVAAGDASAVGVKIMHAGGVDYVLSTTADGEPTRFADAKERRELELTGRLGVVRLAADAEPTLLLMRGSRLALDGRATDRQISEE